MFDLTIEEWKNLTEAVASVLTSAAIVVGAWWAWRRFRRTPESRAKIDLKLVGTWARPNSSPETYLHVNIGVANAGGRKRTLAAKSGAAPSRIACWSLTATARDEGAVTNGYVDWAPTPVAAARLLARDLILQPGDSWDETVLFKLPRSAEAARALVYLYVGGEDDPITASTVVVPPAVVEEV